jgi:hypothetical protein
MVKTERTIVKHKQTRFSDPEMRYPITEQDKIAK